MTVGAPYRSASQSWVATASNCPLAAITAAWASPSASALNAGIPIKVSISIDSSTISGVYLTQRCANLWAVAKSPTASAAFQSASACSLRSLLASISSFFSSGCFPSKMKTGLTPFERSRDALDRNPIKCATTLPLSALSGPPSPVGERSRMVVRNWNASRKLSIPTFLPFIASIVVSSALARSRRLQPMNHAKGAGT